MIPPPPPAFPSSIAGTHYATVRGANAPDESSALPDPIEQLAMGDLAAQLTAVIWKLASDEKKIARDMEATYDKMQDEAENAAVDEKRSKADATMWEGIATGIADLGAGGLTVAAGATMRPAAEGSGTATKYEGLAKCFDGLGKTGAALERSHAEGLDADVTASEHAAAWAKRSAERLHDDVHDQRKSISDALELYRDYCKATNDAKKAAIHGA